ncbi:MAG TPA: fatty acid desaturase, partial [Anaerolineales bacterium]|nr:fatty acid desaturase [Anaerolineales bacterium]
MDSPIIKNRKEPVPGKLNIFLALVTIVVTLSMLWIASHTGSALWFIASVIAFAFLNNTVFSLLHEAVHGIFHPNLAVNNWAGRILAAFFPTGFTFQRIAHLGHHRRNRTDAELFDYYKPGDNLLFKYVQWYGILTGIYWLIPPLASLLFLFTPVPLIKRIMAYSESSDISYQTSADGMLSGYKNAPFGRIKGEILLTIFIQIAIFYLLDLSLWGWLACYAAFGFNWSSLQYTDHAFAERHVYDGAWNLRVNKIVQYLFLNYHHHKVHHQNPSISW